MPFRKYREIKQWGKHNTRIFKEILKARNKQPMPRFVIPPALKAMNVEIHNPNEPGFFDQPNANATSVDHSTFRAPKDEDHPLYKNLKALVFDGSRSFADGVTQACALTKSLNPIQLPDKVINNNTVKWPENIKALVIDSIMAGERYDPTMKQLEKRHDPILFWIIQPTLYGTPPSTKCNVILENLYRRVQLHAIKSKGLMQENRCDYDAPMSAMLSADKFGSESPFVIRHQPHMVVQSSNPVPRVASVEQVQATVNEEIPNIYPLSPVADLTSGHIYNSGPLIPRLHIPFLYLNTLLFNKQQNQKYPFTTDELAANAIMFCFGAALAQAQRTSAATDLLKKPIVTKAIQLVDGRVDLVVFQLNTLDLSNSQGIKNLVWLEKAAPLYWARPYYEDLDTVEELDMDVFRKFASLLLY